MHCCVACWLRTVPSTVVASIMQLSLCAKWGGLYWVSIRTTLMQGVKNETCHSSTDHAIPKAQTESDSGLTACNNDD